jgi:hypothetical protein
MADEQQRQMMRYRILRYTPNLVRDEWVNIGVLLEQQPVSPAPDGPAARRAMRLLDDERGFSRLRRLHPSADEALLRSLGPEFEERLGGTEESASRYLAKLQDSLSNVLQFSPQHAVLAEDFDAEIERLYREQVAPPPRARTGVVESTKEWIHARLGDIFRRRHILGKLEHGVRVDEFTQPGDPFHIDYAYRYNGTRGYLHAVPLGRDYSTAKIFSYTAERIRAKSPGAEFRAITEAAPSRENRRHEFILRLFEEQQISVLPLGGVEAWAESLGPRLR